MIKVDAKHIPMEFWGREEEYPHNEQYLSGYVAGAELKPVMEVSDDFGWDYVYKFPDGRYVYADRNSGEPGILSEEQYIKLTNKHD